MDVFGVHRTLIRDYRSFTEGGTVIRAQSGNGKDTTASAVTGVQSIH